jgi:drug/metabolite transporter (DMT)-like permease
VQKPPISPLAYFILFLPPFFWSTSFIVGRAVAGQVPPWTLNMGRFGVAALILVPLLLHGKAWRAVTRSSLSSLLVMAITGVFAFGSLLYTGLQYTTAINATLVNSTSPIVTACLSWLLIGERMTCRRILGALISFIGVGLLLGQGSLKILLRLRFNPGDLLVFLATFLWGIYSVSAKKLTQIYSPLVLTGLTSIIGLFLLLPVSLIELSYRAIENDSKKIVMAFLYLGIFSSLVAHWAWNRSILAFGPSRASLVYNTQPLFGVVLSVLFLGESLKIYQVVDGVIALGGVILGTAGRPPEKGDRC